LTRTRVGSFEINRALPLRSILPEKIIPIEAGLPFAANQSDARRGGQSSKWAKISARTSESRVAAFFEDRFLAILVLEDKKHSLKPEKVFPQNLPAEKLIEFALRKIG